MKKEQILLVFSIVAAALIAYLNFGLYESVGAAQVGDGKDVATSLNVQYDPQTGLPADFGRGRSILRQRRVEKRPPLPTIAAPEGLPPIWVRLLPWPAPDAAHWATLRERIALTANADHDHDETDGTGEDAGDETADEGEDAPSSDDDPFAKKQKRDPAKVARLVLKDGTEKLCELIPGGALKGQPTWSILEHWPNVEFTVIELNPRNLIPVGSYPVTATEIEATYTTVHLEKTCEKEYHERRIRERVRADDRGALMDLGRWVMDELAPRYGQEAVQFAIATAEEARAIKADMATVRELAGLYRAAFDFEGELRILYDFMNAGNTNDAGVLEVVAQALDRSGAHGPAHELWSRAAEIGSLTARLGLAENLYVSGDLPAALAEFRKVQGSGDSGDQAHAYEGEARVLIRDGRFAEALAAADRAVQASISDASVLNTQGAARYYVGRYADAEQAFRAAMSLSPPTETRAQSNLGMALVAQGKLDAAESAFRACIDADPLNYFDPIVGLGGVLQRRGDLTAANDYFETALLRDPKNPWMLLRLGMSKLTDGVPERAAELAGQLVAEAPGCVDGLRLAGLAIRDQAAPDFDLALRHFERAIGKEPQNVDLLRQYAAALLTAGKPEQALSVLSGATATGVGFARRDGRTLALYAYTLFVNRKPIELVREAIEKALRAEIDDAAIEYVKGMRDAINDWDALRIWTDDFQRSGENLFGGWKEDDSRLGVKIGAVQTGGEDYAKFVGRAKNAAEDRADTSLTRSESAKNIRQWQASVRMITTDTQFVMHVFSGTLQVPGSGAKRRGRGGSEFAFVVTRDGKVQVWTTAGTGRTQNLTAIPIKDAAGADVMFPMDGKFHAVRMERTDHQLGRWQLFLDDEPIGDEQEIGSLAAQRGKQLELGFGVDADRGTQIEVHIDRIQITRTVE